VGSVKPGKFSDYAGVQGGESTPKDAPPDLCEKPLRNVALEEVATAPYYLEHEDVPSAGTSVSVRRALVGGRIAVETVDGAQVIGYVPTERNYLRRCMEQGYSYRGSVVSSAALPVPSVRVDLEATE
jgi:hypothetical protein